VDGCGDLRRRFEENDGRVGTVFYVRYKNELSLSNGRNLLRIAKTTDNVKLADGTVVQTASRSTVFAEVIRSMERDGPIATAVSFGAVIVVVLFATASARGAVSVLGALLLGVLVTIGGAAVLDVKLNFFNFIALPITFGIGCEYPTCRRRSGSPVARSLSAATRPRSAMARCYFRISKRSSRSVSLR
jgi:predicted RND superfamily exporter protein